MDELAKRFKGIAANPLHVGIGLLAGVILSPLLLFVFWTLLVPLVVVVAVLAVVAMLYAKLKLKATFQDWLLVKGIAVPRVQQILATKKNHLTDDYWYAQYAKADKDAPMIIQAEDDSRLTWGEMEAFSNRIAAWAIAQKWPVNTTVGLFLPNRPEFVGVWLGLAKVGIRTALLNFNLRNVALAHSIKTGECKALIYDSELTQAVGDIIGDLSELKIPLFAFDGKTEQANSVGATLLQPVLQTTSAGPVAPQNRAAARGCKVDDAFLYIYTSGTTGLPKASKISHFRFRSVGGAFGGIYGLARKDIVYCPLPLYHSAGGMIGVGCVFQSGCTMVLRKKFTATGFSKDCKKYGVTVMQYIGELCRYLLATPEQPEDKQLSIRCAIGNGLRPDVWRDFKQRFRIGQIGEFYAATEGANALFNVGDVEHSIGYLSPVVNLILPFAIVRYDQEKDEIVRGPDGRCIRCKPGEPGEFIAKIIRQFGASNYSGYTDKSASDKKVINNAFKDGDAWFRSGDLLKSDEQGNAFFVDRVGDTFRWKGENCATSEVAQVMGMFKGIPEANVYGVTVPHSDGRAGMAAITGADPKKLDFAALLAHLQKNLPRYAVPLFLRFLPAALDVTSTFKHLKNDLRTAGFDPAKVRDPMYFFDGKAYVPLTADIVRGLEDGKIRV